MGKKKGKILTVSSVYKSVTHTKHNTFFNFTQMYGIELMIMIIATLGSALSAESFAVSVSGVLILWRVILGVGIGGDYPMSAGS